MDIKNKAVPAPDKFPAGSTKNSPTILELKDVVAGYAKTTILNGTTFSVHRGAITTIIGPNGAGKSTVFKTLFGLVAARSGSITFNGENITNAAPKRLLSLGMCYIPQGRNIFPELSVLHNLELGGLAAPDLSDLNDRIERTMERFPMLRKKAHQQASTLSGGEQKLLEIARGLLLDPVLLLIDEPSIGLSPKMVQETFALLTELRSRGVTTLMVEQNAKSALQMSDYGLVLELGQTRMHDVANTILHDPKVAKLFLGAAMA